MRKNNTFIIAVLTILSLIGLVYLLLPYASPLFFALILAIAFANFKEEVNKKLNKYSNHNIISSLLICLLILCAVVIPITYLSLESVNQIKNLTPEITKFINENHLFTKDKLISSENFINQFFKNFGISLTKIEIYLRDNLQIIFSQIGSIIQKYGLNLILKSTDFGVEFIKFWTISLFALFVIFNNQNKLLQHFSNLIPLYKAQRKILFINIKYHTNILIVTSLLIALAQGITMAFIAYLIDLPIIFIATAVIISSFIPLIGSALVWLPMLIYILIIGKYGEAGLVFLVGTIVNGILIDNVLRQVLILRYNKKTNNKNIVVMPTIIYILVSFSGLLYFGILGIIFGPLLAAICITILKIYQNSKKYRHTT